MFRPTIAAIILALPGQAWAVPAQLSHQGRLMDSSDTPLEGEHTLTFTIYDSEESGAELWQESLEVSFSNGFYSTVLGSDEDDNPLDTELLGAHPLFLAMAVDGGSDLEPRHEILSVPYAMMADTCENVDGGIVDAEEVRVAGATVIAADGTWAGATPSVGWADLSGIPEGFADNVDDDQDTLAGLTCEDGEILAFSVAEDGWVCDTDDTLSSEDVEAVVEAFVATTPVDLAAGSTVGGAAIPSADSVPSGVIVMWSGTEVPEGWALCDGESGTPDLRNRFVVGAGDTYEQGETGGSTSSVSASTTSFGIHDTTCGMTHTTCYSVVSSVSGGAGVPPYYALAYIMKL